MDYFKENREGIFLQRKSIPMYVGLSTKPWVNIGKMRNSGIDASLEYHQPLGKDLHLTVRGNFTYARNRIMDQDEPDYAYTYMNHSGQMQWQKFGLVAAGLFQDCLLYTSTATFRNFIRQRYSVRRLPTPFHRYISAAVSGTRAEPRSSRGLSLIHI